MRIRIFTTGGSIDKFYSTQKSDFIVGPPQIEQILIEANINLDYQIKSLMQKDSLEITTEDRRSIYQHVLNDPSREIVITHGTDTMIESAKVLADVRDKVIVLTGAIQPATFRTSDAAFNVGCAIMAVQILPEGIYIVMNGKVFDPIKSRKNIRLDRFEAI